MSIQTIIDSAQSITINRRAVVAQSVSRSQQIKTAERGYRVWKFTVSPSPGLKWENYRGMIEAIDNKDKITETQISLANNANMGWTVAYQGEFTQGALDAITISSVTGNSLTLTTLPTVSSTTIAFKAGDYIQPDGSRYPYTVVNTVLRGSGNTITLTVNRGMIADITLANAGILVGSQVTWRVVPVMLPDYTLTPGRFIAWSGDFELMEVIQ